MSQPSPSPFIPINIIQRILTYSQRSQKRKAAFRDEFGDLTRQAAETVEPKSTRRLDSITAAGQTQTGGKL